MSDFLRYTGALFCAAWVALGLFGVMTSLVSRDSSQLGKAGQRLVMSFIRIDDQATEVQKRQRERPKPPEKPQPVPLMEAVPTKQAPTPRPLSIDMPLPDFRPELAMSGLPVAQAPAPAGPTHPVTYTQPLTPISQVPPMYPRRAMLDGISGWVRLTFIITEDGSVRNIEVNEANPRRGIFDHEATRALSRWKFKPQMLDGKPVPAMATITVNFNLES